MLYCTLDLLMEQLFRLVVQLSGSLFRAGDDLVNQQLLRGSAKFKRSIIAQLTSLLEY